MPEHGTWTKDINGRQVTRTAETPADAVRFQFEGWTRKKERARMAAPAAPEEQSEGADTAAAKSTARKSPK